MQWIMFQVYSFHISNFENIAQCVKEDMSFVIFFKKNFLFTFFFTFFSV